MRYLRLACTGLFFSFLFLSSSGCGWVPATLSTFLLALVTAAAMGCMERSMGAPDNDGGVEHDGGDGGVGIDVDAAPDAGPSLCGQGVCPDRMTCVMMPSEGAWCLPDADNDGVPDEDDNCPYLSNPDQKDQDGDGAGDACDLCPEPNHLVACGDDCCYDADGDGVPGTIEWPSMDPAVDNCPYLYNPDQTDTDGDGIGDACDLCPDVPDILSPCGVICLDSDGDGILDFGRCTGEADDLCPYTPSEGSDDWDKDGVDDVCDPDGRPPVLGSSEPMGSRLGLRRRILHRLVNQGIIGPETAEAAMGLWAAA